LWEAVKGEIVDMPQLELKVDEIIKGAYWADRIYFEKI
jgi:hypothetical protein